MMKLIYNILFYLTHPAFYFKSLKLHSQCEEISRKKKIKQEEKVSIVIVTYNALDYVRLCFTSLAKTNYKNKEVVVVDNNSSAEVKRYLKEAKKKKLIDVLHLSPVNTYFTGGNNIGASLSSERSKYLLFLNSDIEIRDPDWLNILLENVPKGGIISFGKVDVPVVRPDGWCFMVDKKTFKHLGGLNEYYKMDWGITEFTAKVLHAGYKVKSIVNPNNFVYHFGQKSRPKRRPKEFHKMSVSQVIKLFKDKSITLLRMTD